MEFIVFYLDWAGTSKELEEILSDWKEAADKMNGVKYVGHWIPHSTGVKAAVVLPDATVVEGVVEDQCKTLQQGEIIQFERFGFVRIAEVNDRILAYFAHR